MNLDVCFYFTAPPCLKSIFRDGLSGVALPRLMVYFCYPSKDGEFDVKSAHTMIAGLDFNNTSPLFKLIWKWPGLERIKTFLWIVANEALHTNFLRFNCHLSPSSDCKRYNEGLHETILHTLRVCPILEEFWHRLLPATHWLNFFTADLHRWLRFNLVADWEVEGHCWSHIFGSALHYLWRVRNEEVFQQSTPNPIQIYDRFWHYFKRNLIPIVVGDSILTSQGRNLSYITWMTPTDTWLKINSDGSVRNHNIAACGGILRDADGNHVRSFATNIGFCPVVVAELRDAYRGLNIAWSLGYTRVILEMDSSCVISRILKQLDIRHPYAMLIRKIHYLISQNWVVQVQHVFREANRAADFMATKGHELHLGMTIFCDPPVGLSSILLDDVRGVAFLRLIS